MYRIRLVSGTEQVYRSIQELTAGVQRGEVTAEAEIYHQRTERWLSIETHPHFRMAQEGGTVTRPSRPSRPSSPSRLKFTRPANPGPNSGVLPTPAAQQPADGDLEELNRLLVLLDPLPTPAQRAEPAAPPAPAKPELTLVPPKSSEPPAASEASEPEFGTMLRLEDLEPHAPVEPPESPAAMEVIRDERVTEPEAEPEPLPAEPPAAAPISELAPDVVLADLGLPVEIHLDEIPVPMELETVPVAEAHAPPADAAEALNAEAPAESPWPAPTFAAPTMDTESTDHPGAPLPEDVPFEEPVAEQIGNAVEFGALSGRRFRPMLYVGAAALIAAVVFAFTGGGQDPEHGMVSPASATSAGAVATTPSTPSDAPQAAPAAPVPSAPTVGFPLPSPQPKPAAATRDSLPPAAVLPSAPSVDLNTGGPVSVDAGTAGSRPGAGSGAELARGYAAAYDALDSDFSDQMGKSGLVRLFSQTQLTTTDGLVGARRALDATSAALRQYHQREAAIEKAYQDSARSLERRGASATDLRDWMTHPAQKESSEDANEGTRLVGQIDAVFALLQGQSGRYRLQGSTIQFDNADVGARYADLQSWITRRLEHWAGQSASSVPTTLQPILDGIGLTRLPSPR